MATTAKVKKNENYWFEFPILSGQQMPAYLNLQTRLFRLLPSSWMKLPICAEIQAKTIMIDEFDSTRNFTANIAPVTSENEASLTFA